MKKRILAVVAAASITALVSGANASAVDNVIRKTTTYYHTTVKSTTIVNRDGEDEISNASSEEIEGDTQGADVAAEIERQKQAIDTYMNAYSDNYKLEEDITDYYFDGIHDEIIEINETNKDELCEGITSGCDIGKVVIWTKMEKHQTYQINARLTILDSLDLTLQTPYVGDEVTVTEDPTQDTLNQSNAPVVNGDNVGVEANWIECDEQVGVGSLFEGTIEANKEYCAVMNVAAKSGYAFKNGIQVTVNGEDPMTKLMYAESGVVFAKIKSQEKPVESPDTGDNIAAFVLLAGIGAVGLTGTAIRIKASRR